MKRLFTLCLASCFLVLISFTNCNAQCCATGVNLLATYNPNFQDTFSTVPHGFTNSNIFATHPTGSGYYYDIASRNYGACGLTPQYDHTFGDTSGRYLWFDTPYSATELNPAVAWMPYDPSLPLAQQNLITVTPNTTYVFSIWVRDLARTSDCISGGAPVAGIRINGADMGEINLGLITTPCCPQWTFLCALWNSGSDTSVLLKIESRSGNGFTDLGIDDVYFGVQTPGGPTLGIGNDTAVCTGESVLLEASLPHASYLWSTGSNDSEIVVTQPGIYSVQVWQNSCVVTDTINVTLKTFHPVTLGHDTALCSGSNVVLNAFMPGASYLWQDGSANATFTATQAGTYTVAITDSGCVAVDSVLVGVIQVAPVYITADTNVICPNDTVLICAPPGYTGYLWNTGATTNCIYTSLQGSYSVAATDTSGCAAISNHVSVTVLHPPVISITGGDTIAVCTTDSIQLCTQPGYAAYGWSTGQTSNCITAHTAGLYIVTVTDFNGCASTTSDSVIAFGGAAPVTITPDKTKMCASDSAQICAPPGYAHYTWNNGDTTVCINTQSAGNYYVTVTENGNCTTTSNHITISVYASPPVSISVNGDTLTGYNSNSYQWLLNGVPVSGATSAIFITHSSGSYTLQVTDTNGCVTTSNPVDITGIAHELMENSISIYPNPTSTGWQLSVNSELVGSNVQIFDATGRLVFLTTINKQLSTIEISGLANGVYELRITGQGYSVVRKLVKM